MGGKSRPFMYLLSQPFFLLFIRKQTNKQTNEPHLHNGNLCTFSTCLGERASSLPVLFQASVHVRTVFPTRLLIVQHVTDMLWIIQQCKFPLVLVFLFSLICLRERGVGDGVTCRPTYEFFCFSLKTHFSFGVRKRDGVKPSFPLVVKILLL